MNQKEFNQIINSCHKKGKLRLELLKALPEETKNQVALYIIRNRGPVIKELTLGLDQSWLHSMGYLYATKGKRFTFVHTSEHKII